MSFSVQARFALISVTITSDQDYTPLIVEDMANVARRTLVRTDSDIEAAVDTELTLEEAQALDTEDDTL